MHCLFYTNHYSLAIILYILSRIIHFKIKCHSQSFIAQIEDIYIGIISSNRRAFKRKTAWKWMVTKNIFAIQTFLYGSVHKPARCDNTKTVSQFDVIGDSWDIEDALHVFHLHKTLPLCVLGTIVFRKYAFVHHIFWYAVIYFHESDVHWDNTA